MTVSCLFCDYAWRKHVANVCAFHIPKLAHVVHVGVTYGRPQAYENTREIWVNV